MRTSSRIGRLRAELARRGVDAMLVSSPESIRYLCRFAGSNGLLVVRDNAAFLLTDSRYAEQTKSGLRGVRRIIAAGSLAEEVFRRTLLAGCASVGFEEDHLTVQRFRRIKSLFRGIQFRMAGGVIEQLAAVKEKEEVDAIAAAARITDTVFGEIVSLLRPGVTERDIAAEISYRQRLHGAEGDAFDVIVAAGPHSAQPHAKASDRKIRAGDPVVLDFGCLVEGYRSDLTRTVSVGRASAEFKFLYATVRSAQEEAIAAAHEGMEAHVLDGVARRRIAASGLGKYFIHALGHGLGLHVHELPRVSPLSTDTLQAGHVLTIEPGVYLPDVGGVRIEDDVVIRHNGCDVLTTSPKELMVI